MSFIKEVEINGQKYSITRATALKQRELFLLLSGKIIMTKGSIDASKDDVLAVDFLVAVFCTLPPAVFSQIENIVLWKTISNEETISVENFQNNMLSYMNLVAEGVIYNLGDFLDYLGISRE